jgi:hypothetical protein
VQELPITPAGKVDRSLLADRVAHGLGRPLTPSGQQRAEVPAP